jgi:hypothetical protein
MQAVDAFHEANPFYSAKTGLKVMRLIDELLLSGLCLSNYYKRKIVSETCGNDSWKPHAELLPYPASGLSDAHLATFEDLFAE